MARPISLTLMANRSATATTECLVMWVTPVTPGFASYGVAMLDRAVQYDHGDGVHEYSPVMGMQPSTISQSADLSVNNAEATGLMPEFDVPIKEADIAAGVYDFAEFVLYLIDYEHPVTGSGLVVGAGTFGRVTVQDEGLSIVNELRGLTDQLKQSLCQKDSLSCRAVFGSGHIGSGAEVEELFPCLFDLSTITESGVVESVGLETNLTFTHEPDSSLGYTEDELLGGVVKWTSGANNGRSYEIEGNDDAGEITLAFPADFPIQVGDTFLVHPGCSKIARDATRGCKHWFEELWPIRFRGEPDIPIGDAGSIETPGASSGPGEGGAVRQPYDAE